MTAEQRVRGMQRRQMYLTALGAIDVLIEVGDPELWLRAHDLLMDALIAQRAQRLLADAHEDGGSWPNPDGEG